MGLIIFGTASPYPASTWSGTGLEVDASNQVLVTFRSPAFQAGNGMSGRVAIASGALTFPFPVAAGLPVFAMRTNPSGSKIVKLNRVRIGAIVASTISTATAMEMDLWVLRNMTMPVSGTSYTFAGDEFAQQNAMRSGQSSSSFESIAALNTMPVVQSGMLVDAYNCASAEQLLMGVALANSGTAVGTGIFGAQGAEQSGMQPLYSRVVEDLYPILLMPGDGLIVSNGLTGPATGSATFLLDVDWTEVAAY